MAGGRFSAPGGGVGGVGGRAGWSQEAQAGAKRSAGAGGALPQRTRVATAFKMCPARAIWCKDLGGGGDL